ncbi:MAG: neutral/alkaline non-lysosomal ceramidase N-terminal domain-containing protein [Verrucomicrobiota bacterium]|nr:neutral/alkaline non-lysosomal ceramidase N-terminal domain-containing protein [Verrucomicrobiota bacterium]
MIQPRSLSPLLLLTLGLLVSSEELPAQAPAAKSGRVFSAGAATSNITPPLGAGIVGGWNAPPATHIHDELHTRCLVLDDGQTRLAFAIVDSVSVNREVFDEAKRLVHEASGLAKEHMLMAATHTHSGPSARGESAFSYGRPLDEYQSFLARRISDGVRRAINNLEPARIGWGAGDVPQHVFNRRWKMKPGTPMPNPFGGQDKVVMNPGVGNPALLEPAGPTDPQVSFLSVQSMAGRPIALLANYSLHYVGGTKGGHISADYFGMFADRIQQLLQADRQDPPFVGVMSNGTSGDVNNINFRVRGAKHAPYEKMRIVANDVAAEVFRVFQTIEHRDWVELKAAQTELTLQTRQPTPEMLDRARQVLARPDSVSPFHRHEKTYAERTLKMAEWPKEISIILQAFRIGELGIATTPFETFAETGLELKANSLIKPAFVIELANGGYGYLPTPGQHALGGYETWLGTNRVEVEASRKIVATLLELLGALKR